ncbi:LptF/LptG family permease [Desulfurivibrio alkaliphilus]|uniref:Permease YjgP/YjgQ family protein n=1 Tax=Desulfurivibrio alkaliphilus (strain DSM 19089 / UNIQEM U267 / AHT2) TaxID=589865 RepID=D6Z3E4_DESAT|nr:LptF/LptG family permease [Desulfurivibrio alkaliphilus]ADH86069.1 permease YjgP/YjgQ family protein [Desulfurivibrio alkaliphilus AHT 2]
MIMLLDRYLFWQFTRNLALVLGGLVAIYLLIDFFERVDSFLDAGLGIGTAITYLLLKIPLIFEQLIPVCLLLAGIITLGVLNRHNELMALKSGGLSVRRIIRPLLLAALFFSGLALAAGQWLLPPTLAETNRLWYEEVRQQTPEGIERNGRIYYRGAKGIYSFAQPDDPASGLPDFSFTAWNEEYQLARLLTAAIAHWEAGRWTLLDGQLKVLTADDQYRTTIFNEMTIELPERPEDFFLPPYALAERPLSELLARALAPEDSPRRYEARLELQQKISYIFLGLPLLLVGIPLLLAMHRGRGRDLALAVPASCIMAFAVWGLWSICQALASAGHLSPALAAWLVHLLAGSLGFYFILRQDT